MKRPKVFISQWMPEAGIKLIQEYCDVDYNNSIEPIEHQEFIRRAKDAEALVIFVSDTISEEIIKECPKLKVISSFGKGYDNIDMEACNRNNIIVTVNPSSLTDSTADLAIALLLTLCRNIIPSDYHVRTKEFKGWHATNCLGKDFHHSKLGIIGLGTIGKAIAKRAKAFETEISYYDVVRSIDFEKQNGLTYISSIEELLSQNDFIILAVDYQPENYHLIDENRINIMKKDSILINICRGSIVDETAISKALNEGSIWGYASDVFEFEDKLIPEHPKYIPESLLEQREKTVFTPHIGTGTVEAREKLALSTAEQLISAINGEVPTGAVNHLK